MYWFWKEPFWIGSIKSRFKSFLNFSYEEKTELSLSFISFWFCRENEYYFSAELNLKEISYVLDVYATYVSALMTRKSCAIGIQVVGMDASFASSFLASCFRSIQLFTKKESDQKYGLVLTYIKGNFVETFYRHAQPDWYN